MIHNPFGYIKHNLEASASLFDYVTGGSCPGDIEDLKPGEVSSTEQKNRMKVYLYLGLYSS